jgi:predicted nuclease of predicted toxin-antitoxin system
VRFLLDHDVPERVGDVLQQEGHSVTYVRNVLAPDAPDTEVLQHANAKELILVTCNRDDFVRLAESASHHGIVVLIRRHSRLAECSSLLRLVRNAGESGLAGNINFA